MKLLVVSILLCALLGAQAAPQRLQITKLSSHPLKQDACETCMDVIHDIDAYINDKGTKDYVIDLLDAAVCDALPQEFADMCTQEVPILVAQAADLLTQALSAPDVCSMVGACSGPLSLAHYTHSTPLAAPFECPVCKMVATIFIQRLKNPDTRQQIESNADEACNELDTEPAREKCTEDVKNLFDAIDALLDDVDPLRACEVAQFCNDDDGKKSKSGVAVGVGVGVKVLKGLVAKLGDTPRLRADETCDTCMAVIQQAVAVLEDPNTQKELMDYAREGCDFLSDFSQQCHAYINQYGPLVIGMAISYLQPEPFCVRLGYCPAPNLMDA